MYYSLPGRVVKFFEQGTRSNFKNRVASTLGYPQGPVREMTSSHRDSVQWNNEIISRFVFFLSKKNLKFCFYLFFKKKFNFVLQIQFFKNKFLQLFFFKFFFFKRFFLQNLFFFKILFSIFFSIFFLQIFWFSNFFPHFFQFFVSNFFVQILFVKKKFSSIF